MIRDAASSGTTADACVGTPSTRFIRASTMLVAAVGEVGLAVVLVVDPASLEIAWLLHVVIVGALALDLARPTGGRGATERFDVFFLIVTALLGPVGACGALLTKALLPGFSRRTIPFEVWFASLFEGSEVSSALAMRRQILLEKNNAEERSSVAPFADVMESGSVEQKQSVIALIASNFRPEFARPLLTAMNDAEPTVRVMAATAAARIENQFLARSMALEDARARDLRSVEPTFKLARHYDDYANTGLLDQGRALNSRTRALDLYRYCQRLRAEDPEVLNAIIRLLVRLGRECEAVESFSPLLAGGTAAPELFVWYVESLYRMRRFQALRQACKHFDADAVDRTRVSERCRQAIAFWAADGFTP